MKAPYSYRPDDFTQEHEELLRDTLQNHTQRVNVEHGKATIADRVVLLKQHTRTSASSRLWLSTFKSQKKKVRILAAVSVVALLSIVLVGAGFAGGFFWNYTPPKGSDLQQIHDTHTFGYVNQSKRIGQITVTVMWAYADLNSTVIAYNIQMPAVMEKQYRVVTPTEWSLTDLQGHDPAYNGGGGVGGCEPLPLDGSPLYCTMDDPQFDLGPNATSITINFGIISIMLQASSHKITVYGPWLFTFTIPFNHTKLLHPTFPTVVNR